MARAEGIEPPTSWLTASCSAIELRTNKWNGGNGCFRLTDLRIFSPSLLPTELRCHKWWIHVGFEPTTSRLQGERSTNWANDP